MESAIFFVAMGFCAGLIVGILINYCALSGGWW